LSLLSPILFNLFINDISIKYDKYGISIGDKRCCGGFFADDIVLFALTRFQLKKLLKLASKWAINNEMKFGIEKYTSFVV
jgi:hypothetical protein